MPVRPLNSSMLVWPNAKAVDSAVRQWAQDILQRNPGVIRVGYFGSYARGDWGVGSDLDLIVLVERTEVPFERRPIYWDVTDLPVPTDLLVYSLQEWESVRTSTDFCRRASKEAVWVYDRTTALSRW